MKTLSLIFGCLLLLVIPSSVFAEASTDRQAAEKQQQLKDPNQQFEEIESYIASRQQEIENYYTDQFIELNQRAEAEIRQLEIADKPCAAGLAAQAETAKFVLRINNYGYQMPWELEAKTERTLPVKAEQFAMLQSQIAERRSAILAKLEQEATDLERGKNYALTVTLPELEKQLKQDMLKPEPKPTHGVVTGIVYSADKPSAIVGRQIVHEGDVIYGVTVVKIYKDKVNFSKKSKNWEQKVQQAPEGYWK